MILVRTINTRSLDEFFVSQQKLEIPKYAPHTRAPDERYAAEDFPDGYKCCPT
jgi:hypothetical protein